MDRVEELAKGIKLYSTWHSNKGDIRTWDDVRKDIAKAIRTAQKEAQKKERARCAGIARDWGHTGEKTHLDIAAVIREGG